MKKSIDAEGILNGLPPFKADFVYAEHGGTPPEPWQGVQWCVVDAEKSVVAIVCGGEEMAEFFAESLNKLASTTGHHMDTLNRVRHIGPRETCPWARCIEAITDGNRATTATKQAVKKEED